MAQVIQTGWANPAAPAAAPAGGADALINAPAPTVPDLAGRAASFNLPPFNPNATPDPRLTQAQTGAPDPNKSGFANFVSDIWRGAYTPANLAAGQTGTEYDTKLATGPQAHDYVADFFGGNANTRKALDAQAQRAAFYSDPTVRQQVTGNADLYNAAIRDPEGVMSAMQPMLAAVRNPSAPKVANGRNVTNPGHLQLMADQSGATPGQSHPFAEPHQYSEQEFLDATRGLSWNQLGKLFSMQHYIPPQQQAIVEYTSGLKGQADAAGQLYGKLVNDGAPQAKIDAAKKEWDTRRAMVVDALGKLSLGPQSVLPVMSQYTEQ